MIALGKTGMGGAGKVATAGADADDTGAESSSAPTAGLAGAGRSAAAGGCTALGDAAPAEGILGATAPGAADVGAGGPGGLDVRDIGLALGAAACRPG